MKKNVFPEFNPKKHTINIPSYFLVQASQKGGVIIAALDGFYRLEKIEDWKNGAKAKEIIVGETSPSQEGK